MGNAQSVAEGHRSARPQTAGNTRATKSATPATQSGVLSPIFGTEESTASTSPSLVASSTSPVNRQDGGGYQLDHSQSMAWGQQDGHDHRDSQVNSLAATVARSLSRSGSRRKNIVGARSSVAQLQGGSQLAPTNENAVDLNSAIAIIQELRKTASPEDLAALHKALLPVASRDSLALTFATDSQDDCDPATAALIRRKSFAQPGVATRHAKIERNVLRKAIPAPSAKPKPWTKDMMGASPLARLSSLDAPRMEELEPPPELFENRAHTPSDDDYTQLGNLKHGSLMVVNGPPSPNPSVATAGIARRNVSDEHDDAFFTASEHSSSRPGSRWTTTLAEATGVWQQQPTREELSRGRGQVAEYAPPRRDGSPLKKELRQTSPEMTRDAEMDAGSVYSRHVRPVRSMASLRSHRTERFSFEESSSDEVRPPITEHQILSAVSLADEYMSEMPPSPYKDRPVDRDVSPLSSMNDQRDEVEAPGVREQVIMMPPSIAQDAPPISPRKPLGSNPTLEEVAVVPETKPRRALGVNTDSGYLSATTSVVDSMSPVKMRQSNLTTVESLAEGAPPKRNFSSRGTADLAFRIGQIGSHTNTPDSDAEPGIIESIEKDGPKEPKPARSKSWRKSVRRSLPRLLSADSTVTTASKATTASAASSGERRPNKLQKRRPLSQPPISMGDRHLLDRNIPRVPSTVFSRYSGRLSMSLGMQHLESTSEDAVDSRKNSFDPMSSKTNLPAWFFPDAELETKPGPATHRLSFKRKSFRRSSTQIDESEILTTGIADFGTVSQSLGTSPYDIAHSGARRSFFGGATQPHHLSTKATRVGPREGWDAETASRFAQNKSRERAAQQQAWEQQQYAERRPLAARAMSYHADMAARPVPRPQNTPLQRPKSMHAQQAPVTPSQPYRMPSRKPVPSLPDVPPRQPRPSTSPHERDVSPVKKLVSAFEQKAAETQAPPPMPSAQPDWSDSSRMWRERRLNAETSAVIASSPPPQTRTMTTTTTTMMTTSGYGSEKPRTTTTTTTTPSAMRPALESRKSMPQMQQGQPMTMSTTTTSYLSEGRVSSYVENRGPYTSGNHFGSGIRNKDVGPTSYNGRRFYGVDMGDVPVRVI